MKCLGYFHHYTHSKALASLTKIYKITYFTWASEKEIESEYGMQILHEDCSSHQENKMC